MKLGIAMAASTPRITTTTISSISVNASFLRSAGAGSVVGSMGLVHCKICLRRIPALRQPLVIIHERARGRCVSHLEACCRPRLMPNPHSTHHCTTRKPQNPAMHCSGGSSPSGGQQSAAVVHFSLILEHIGTSQPHCPSACPARVRQYPQQQSKIGRAHV